MRVDEVAEQGEARQPQARRQEVTAEVVLAAVAAEAAPRRRPQQLHSRSHSSTSV